MTKQETTGLREKLFEELGDAFERAIRELGEKPRQKKAKKEEKPARLHIDFPELTDPQRLRERFGDALEEHIGVFHEALFVAIHIPKLVSMTLPQIYDLYLPEEGDYDPKEVLAETVEQQRVMLMFLKDFLERNLNRALEEALNFAVQEKLPLSQAELRNKIEAQYRIRFDPGRPPEPEDSEQAKKIKALYETLERILKPGFDRVIVTKMKAALDAAEYCNQLKPMRVDTIADKLWSRRSVKQAAVWLTALTLDVSESTVKRHI